MDATASSVAASTGRGRGAAAAGARAAGVAAICTRAVASFDGFAPLRSPPGRAAVSGVEGVCDELARLDHDL